MQSRGVQFYTVQYFMQIISKIQQRLTGGYAGSKAKPGEAFQCCLCIVKYLKRGRAGCSRGQEGRNTVQCKQYATG